MKKAILLIPLLFGFLTFGQTPVDAPHLELVWEDHFNNINPNIWLVQNNFDHYGQEVQVYTDRLNNTSLFSKCYDVFFSFLHRTHVIKIILNFAIRPDYLPNQTSPFPSDMLIDFVKVYKLRNDCNTVLNACNYNFGMHDNKVKRSITIGNNSCVNSLVSIQWKKTQQQH